MRIFFTLFILICFFSKSSTQVVIQEIFGGAGSVSSPWNREVIIIKNYGPTSTDISDWAIQYNTATGTSAWQLAPIPGTVVLSSGQSYIFCISNVQMGISAPPCDGISANSINISQSGGRIALTSNETLLPTGEMSCPTIEGAVKDFVPYGSATNCSLETPNPSATSSVVRPNAMSTPNQWVVNSSPLPIELISFHIHKLENTSLLSFSTSSETNNDYFTIERSADGKSFDAIAEIDGAGNSSETLEYTYTDASPLPGVNYYRLKQTDFDGQYSYSDIKSVRHQGASSISISPRTTEGQLYIKSDLESYSLKIFNASGMEVMSYPAMSFDQSIQIDALQSGVYFVKAFSGIDSETHRIVKL